MRQQEKDEARRILQGMKNRNSEMEAYEKELDRLIEEERLRRERKADEDWEKKERARINLLHQVFDDREKKVKQHQSEKDEEKRQKEIDRIEVEKRLNAYQAEQERKRQEEWKRGKEEQLKLLKEIAEKEERRRMILQELHREEQNMEAARQSYDQQIQERKIQGREQLDEFKKTNRLF